MIEMFSALFLIFSQVNAENSKNDIVLRIREGTPDIKKLKLSFVCPNKYKLSFFFDEKDKLYSLTARGSQVIDFQKIVKHAVNGQRFVMFTPFHCLENGDFSFSISVLSSSITNNSMSPSRNIFGHVRKDASGILSATIE